MREAGIESPVRGVGMYWAQECEIGAIHCLLEYKFMIFILFITVLELNIITHFQTYILIRENLTRSHD